MKVVVIAPLSAAQVAELQAIDPRLVVEQVWELFGPELVAEWPAQTVDLYLPPRFRGIQDSPALQRRRDALLAEADVVCFTFPFPLRLAQRAPRLRFVQQLPAGASNLTRGDLWGSSIPVSTGRGANLTLPIAEWAIAAGLALYKDLPRALAQKASGQLERTAIRGRQVADTTLGVVGLGGIGQHVARLGRGLGMRVIGTRRSAEPVEHVDELYPPAGLHAVLAQSDLVVVSAQLTVETHHLIDAAALAALKRGAFLVNVARGELVDETALVAALRSRHVGGFAADVYEGEFDRPPPAELLSLENVILTPHTSGQGGEQAPGSLAIFGENLRRLLAGETLLNLVNWDRGY